MVLVQKWPFFQLFLYAPCSLANKPCAVQCALLGVSSVCWENWTDTLICRNLATQLSGRLLIIPNQITQKPEIKTSSQQRWGQPRQSPDRPLETGPPPQNGGRCCECFRDRTGLFYPLYAAPSREILPNRLNTILSEAFQEIFGSPVRRSKQQQNE